MAILRWIVVIALLFGASIASAETNAALNKPFTVVWPAIADSHPPTNLSPVVDGDYSTGSITGVNLDCMNEYSRIDTTTMNYAYIQLDLQGYYNISSIGMKTIVRTGTIGDKDNVSLQYSSNNITWTNLLNHTYELPGSTCVETNTTTSVFSIIRYIRSSPYSQSGPNPSVITRWYEITANGTIESPVLFTPINQSKQYKSYPPLISALNFTWTNGGGLNSNFVVSSDINFNIIVTDTTILNNYSVQSLPGGNYWWKVRYYNSTSGVYNNWSDTSNFTFTNNYTTSGKAGVEGIVYEMIGGVQTPISGATVHLYNASYSTSMITGSNGYYLFDNLANSSTYSIYAEKQGYDTTAVFPVTTGLGTRTINNILMRIYISPYVPNFVFEKFVVRGLFDNPYPGVTVTVYKGSDILPYLTGTTDSMGQVVFQLIKDQYYRVTFSGGGLSSTITVYVYAKEESYLITVISGFPTTPNRDSAISANLTVFTLNATHSNLSLIYNDSSSTTTGINFTVKNATTGAVMCSSSSASQIIQLNCTVQSIGVYQFGYNATSTTYGTFSEIKYINFGAGNPTNPTIPTQGTSPNLLHWGSIILIVIVAALFSIRTVKYGAIMVPFMAGALWWVGWFQVNGLIIAITIVIGIMVYIRQSEQKVSY